MSALSLSFEPLLPVWALAGLGGLLAVVLLAGVLAGARGSALRALAGAALVLALANPSVVSEERDPLSDIALLVVDETPSQEIGARAEQTARAAETLRARLDAFEPGLEVREIRVRHRSIADGEDGTRLIEPLRDALADVPAGRFAGAVLVTDGQIHDAPEDWGTLGLDGPVHSVLTGGEAEGDRRLVVVEAPSFGLVDREVPLVLRIEDPAADGRARVTLRVDGGEPRTVELPLNEDAEAPITLDHRGPTVVEIEVEEGPRELTLANNAAVVSVNGVRDRLRVLLVSGEPHPGERTWRNLLKSDPSVDLVHFTILRPPEKQDGTPIHELSLIAFPTRELFEIKLDEFDLIVFDRYRRRGVLPSLYLRNVVDYVENGGAVLMAAGPAFAGRFSLFESPLRDALPAAPTGDARDIGFRPRVSERGIRHPVTGALPGGPRVLGDEARDPAWGRWFRQVDAIATDGDVVMTGLEGQPLLVLDRFGDGRVAQVLSDHIWLWARGFEGGGPHNELMRRLAHWLMKEPELAEDALNARVEGDRLVVERRSLDPLLDPDVTVTGPDGETVTLSLQDRRDGRYTAEMPVDRSGLYAVEHGTRTAMAAAGALNPKELADIAASQAVVGPLAEASGGRVVRARDGVPDIRLVQPERIAAGPGWIGLKRNDAYVVRGLSETPLLPGFLALALILSLAALAWRREAR